MSDFTDAEIRLIKAQMLSAQQAALVERVKRGHKLNPRIAAAREKSRG